MGVPVAKIVSLAERSLVWGGVLDLRSISPRKNMRKAPRTHFLLRFSSRVAQHIGPQPDRSGRKNMWIVKEETWRG
jgi:hypothetical protein